MKPPRTAHTMWFALLFAGLLMQAPAASGQEPPSPPLPKLTPEARSRLTEGARDPALAPWQREFMLDVARSSLGTGAPAPALSGVALPRTGVATDDGAWTAVPPPTGRMAHTAIYDPARDRMVVFGGWDRYARNEAWTLSLAGSPYWSGPALAGSLPSGRYLHTAIYDPVRDRMLVFGGYDGSYLNDTWALSLVGSPAWSALAPTGSQPPARAGHTAIYDPVRDRVVVFGGSDGTYLNDTWALSLSGSPAWSALAPAGSPPSGRYFHTAIYDPARDRMLVVGGWDGSLHNDVWALSLGSPAWTALAPAGNPPSARRQHTAIYDPVRDRMVLFGGYDGSDRNDSWVLSLAGSPAWSALAPAGSPPPARSSHTAIYDPVRDRMVVFGGWDGSYRSDTWTLSLAGNSAWAPLNPVGSPPPERYSHAAIYDPVRDRMVVFGGFDGTRRNDVWALSLAATPGWGPLAPSGSPPSGRYFHTAIYDPVRDRMLVVGGYDGGYRNDVWALSLAGSPVWSALAPSGGPPPARAGHTAIYDWVRDRIVVFGGLDAGGYLNDVWSLSLAGSPTWSTLAAAGSPPPARYLHTAIYDPVRDRMVVFGGYDGSYRNDVWSLSMSESPAWSSLVPAGSPPPARNGYTATYDPVRDRMVLIGGYDGMYYHNDVWALSLAGSVAWSGLAPARIPPLERFLHTAIYDPIRDRMVVFGGYDGGYRNDVWGLWWTPPVSVPGTGGPRGFELAPPRPNPSRGETTLGFELGEPTQLALDVFDIRGRRLKRIADGWFPSGRHSVSWRGGDDRGHPLRSGVYLIRIQGDGFRATRRFVLVR